MGKLAAAVAARATHKDCEFPELGERAIAATLAISGAGDAETKAAVEKLSTGLDAATAKTLRDYALKRLASISQYPVDGDFSWDF